MEILELNGIKLNWNCWDKFLPVVTPSKQMQFLKLVKKNRFEELLNLKFHRFRLKIFSELRKFRINFKIFAKHYGNSTENNLKKYSKILSLYFVYSRLPFVRNTKEYKISMFSVYILKKSMKLPRTVNITFKSFPGTYSFSFNCKTDQNIIFSN